MHSGYMEILEDLGAMRVRVGTDFHIDLITRTDTNGTAPVRLREGQLPRPDAELFVFDDFEVSNGPVSYTFSGAYVDDPEQPRDNWTLSGVMSLSTPWLGVPAMQTYAQPIDSVLSYDADLDSRATVHELLGRADPVVILRKMSLRRGSLELWAGAHGRTKQILGALSRGEVMMLRQSEHEGQDMYFVAQGASVAALEADSGETLFSVTVQYVEVARPDGPIASARGWDFAQIAAAHGSFLEVASNYFDFQSLALNEGK